MTQPAYYNETNPFCIGVLERRIGDGSLPPGDVDTRDVREVAADDLHGHGQVHLFAGIGGFPLGLRMAGVPDGRSILTGGFPCQPYSVAGERRGAADDRDLWPEMARLVRDVRPDWVLGENVPGIVNAPLGLDRVLSDLESAGYAARALCIPACAVDAPHRRERLWIVAHGQGERVSGSGCEPTVGTARALSGEARQRQRLWPDTTAPGPDRCSIVADVVGAGLPASEQPGEPGTAERGQRARAATREQSGAPVGDAALHGREEGWAQPSVRSGRPAVAESSGWHDAERIVGADGLARRAQPSVRPLAHGIPQRVARLRALGNAVVPQVVAEIADAMMQAEQDDAEEA